MLLLLAAASSPVAAQTAPLLRLGHYSTGDGLTGFVLDRTGMPIKLRFDGSDEIIALVAEPGASGTTALKRDDGATLVRVHESGGVTLFGKASFEGVAAYLDQSAQPPAVAAATRSAAEAKAQLIERQLQRDFAVTLPIVLETSGADEQSAIWTTMADAAVVAGIALRDLLATPLGHEAVAAKLARIVIRSGDRAAVELSDRDLVVTIVAEKPIIGRPSSALIESSLGNLL